MGAWLQGAAPPPTSIISRGDVSSSAKNRLAGPGGHSNDQASLGRSVWQTVLPSLLLRTGEHLSRARPCQELGCGGGAELLSDPVLA